MRAFAVALAAIVYVAGSYWLLKNAPGSQWQGIAERVYVGEHVAVHLLLALVFGLTLRPGRESLITALARRVHGGVTPAMTRYSRKVTVAWTVYFVAMAAFSLALYATVPFATWAVFVAVATPTALIVLFVGEHVLRYRLHPEFERATLSQAVRAYAARAVGHE